MTKIQKLQRLGACPQGIAWVRKHNELPIAALWARCRNVGFMIWLIQEMSWKFSGRFEDIHTGITPSQLRARFPWSYLASDWKAIK